MRPNLVFILIDDLGWMDLGCYGSGFYETPNLDRLAKEGMRFTDAYAACPVCSPTRAAIMSGKSPARVGVTQWIGGHAVGRLCDVPYFHALPASEVSVATALKEGGYQTWHVGKWHLGDRGTWPERHGFEVNVGGCGWGSPHHGYFSPYQCPTLSDGPVGEYLTDRLTEEALKLLEGRDKGRPFFLNFWHYAVHTPIQAPAHLVKKYEEKAKRMGLEEFAATVKGEYFPVLHKRDLRVERRMFQSHAGYAAMVENLDWNIGRLMEGLERAGVLENTLVVFTSDNGGLSTAEGSPTCNLPLSEGKGWMYEGGTRVCQIVRWAGRVKAGSVCAEAVVSMDWYPTFLEAAGFPARAVQHVDGVSLMPLLEGRGGIAREGIYWHYPHYSNQGDSPACAVRIGDWKLIEHFEDGRVELFNLRLDVGETKNLAGERGELVREMHGKLLKWRGEVEGMVPKVNVNWVERTEGVDGAEV